MRGREKFNKFKPLITILTKIYSLFPESIRLWRLNNLRKNSGYIAMAKRYALLKTLAINLGNNVAIYSDVYLKNVQNLDIGNNVSLQPMVYLEAYGGIKIGDNVSIAEGASVFSVNHGINNIDIPIKDQPVEILPVEIESNVWIGSKATILGGVTVAYGTVVAAGAVVNRSTPTNSIVAGVPAIIKKIR